jgi:hypothetical protein
VVVDEPGLARAGISTTDSQLWDPLRTVSPTWGMHICGRVPWELIDAIELDYLSFDVGVEGIPEEHRPVLEALLLRGSRIAWGVIDPVAPERSGAACDRVIACLTAMARNGLDLERVAQQSLLTPACGTGRLSAARERLVAATLDAAAHSGSHAVAALAAEGMGVRPR